MQTTPFIHLNVQSEFSFGKSVATIDALLDRAEGVGMRSLALTDQGNLCGALEFIRKATARGIKPIVGYTATFTWNRFSSADAPTYPLVLLAQDAQGFKNLVQLATAAYSDGYFSRPKIDEPLLIDYLDGLICLSGGSDGELNEALLFEDIERAEKIAGWFKELFRCNFFIELQDRGSKADQKVMPILVELAKRFEIPTVATVEVRCPEPKYCQQLDLISCINQAKFLGDRNRDSTKGSADYFKNVLQLKQSFAGPEDAISRSAEIAERVSLTARDIVSNRCLTYLPDSPSRQEFRDLTQRYGDENVIRFGAPINRRAKEAVLQVMRALAIPPRRTTTIERLMDGQANSTVPELLEENPRLRKLLESDSELREVFQHAETIETLPTGMQSDSGVLIVEPESEATVPIMVSSVDDELISQWTVGEMRLAGFL